MKTARFQFDEDLRALLQRPHEHGGLGYAFNGPQSVKHLVEAAGVPHTEIGSVRANSEGVSTGYLVQDRDSIEVLGNSVGEATDEEPRFVLDGHLGRLNSHLRMLGLDCAYKNDFQDDEILSTGIGEQRIVLTRDRRLLMHRSLSLGYLVRSLDPDEQLAEVVRRYALRCLIRPFQRCIRCNHILEPVSKEQVLDRLEPLTKMYFDEFHICPACGQIYWKGSHYERMLAAIRAIGHLGTENRG
ncbi:MAG: Mut7-C RNAse domain-containing protein [Anaerolineae bacterium]